MPPCLVLPDKIISESYFYAIFGHVYVKKFRVCEIAKIGFIILPLNPF